MTREEKHGITKEVLNSRFYYKDGYLIYKNTPKYNSNLDSFQAGYEHGKGYRKVKINGRSFFTHRLVWIFHHGTYPRLIDHIDGNPVNNKIENLQEANKSINKAKAKVQSNNTSGYKGVSYHKVQRRWQSSITFNGSRKYLGSYMTMKEAVSARKKAEVEYDRSY